MRIRRFNEDVGIVHFALLELKGATKFGQSPSSIIYSAVSNDITNLKNYVINVCNECNETEFLDYNTARNHWNTTMDTYFEIYPAKPEKITGDKCWLAVTLNPNRVTDLRVFNDEISAQMWLQELMDHLAGWEIKVSKSGSMTTDEFKDAPFEEKIDIYNNNNRVGTFLYCSEVQILKDIKINPDIIKKTNIKKFDL